MTYYRRIFICLDFSFYEDLYHCIMGNCIQHRSGQAIVLMRGGTFANHTCVPNTITDIDDKGRVVLRALKPLKPREEVMISYLKIDDETQEQLRLKYWFTCVCPRCTRLGLR